MKFHWGKLPWGLLGLSLFLLPLWPSAVQAYSRDIEIILDELDDPSAIRRYEAIDSLGDLGTPEAIRALIDLTAEEENSWIAVRQLVLLKEAAEPYLLEALRDRNQRIVKFAIYALGDLRSKRAAEPVIEYLSHPDEEIRRNAVFALGYIKDPRAVEPLIQMLKDPDNVVREYAAAALEHLGDRRAVPFLKEALKKEQGSIFNMAHALYSLGGEDVIDLLLDKLKDPESTNRLYAVYSLGKLRDVREVEPLIEVLTDRNIQWLAAKALINLDELAVPSLIKALKSKEKDVKIYASYALGEIADRRATMPLFDLILDTDSDVRNSGAEALIKINDPEVIPPLLDYLQRGDCFIQSQALRILGYIGDRMVTEHIYPLLACDYAMVRLNAAFALGELQDEEAVAYLVDLLADDDTSVSRATANALTKIGSSSVRTLLEKLPEQRGRSETWIIYILGKLKAKEAVDVLITKLSSEDRFVRRYATAALTEIGDPRAEEHLVTMLSDPDPHVRMYASFGLMQFGGRLSIKLLLNALKSEETRWLAIRILDRIGPRGVDELIDALRDEKLRWYAADTLIKLDGDILPQLEEGLRSDEEAIRTNIAMILGEVKDKRAVSALLEALQDESRMVVMAASSLISIGDPSAVEPLIECLRHRNDQVRLYAAYALGHLGDTLAVDPLIMSLDDPDPGIRGVSAYSLGLIKNSRATIPLIEVIDDPDSNVRLAAIYALGKIGDHRGLPYLKERYQRDTHPQVREAARAVLESPAFGLSL